MRLHPDNPDKDGVLNGYRVTWRAFVFRRADPRNMVEMKITELDDETEEEEEKVHRDPSPTYWPIRIPTTLPNEEQLKTNSGAIVRTIYKWVVGYNNDTGLTEGQCAQLDKQFLYIDKDVLPRWIYTRIQEVVKESAAKRAEAHANDPIVRRRERWAATYDFNVRSAHHNRLVDDALGITRTHRVFEDFNDAHPPPLDWKYTEQGRADARDEIFRLNDNHFKPLTDLYEAIHNPDNPDTWNKLKLAAQAYVKRKEVPFHDIPVYDKIYRLWTASPRDEYDIRKDAERYYPVEKTPSFVRALLAWENETRLLEKAKDQLKKCKKRRDTLSAQKASLKENESAEGKTLRHDIKKALKGAKALCAKWEAFIKEHTAKRKVLEEYGPQRMARHWPQDWDKKPEAPRKYRRALIDKVFMKKQNFMERLGLDSDEKDDGKWDLMKSAEYTVHIVQAARIMHVLALYYDPKRTRAREWYEKCKASNTNISYRTYSGWISEPDEGTSYAETKEFVREAGRVPNLEEGDDPPWSKINAVWGPTLATAIANDENTKNWSFRDKIIEGMRGLKTTYSMFGGYTSTPALLQRYERAARRIYESYTRLTSTELADTTIKWTDKLTEELATHIAPEKNEHFELSLYDKGKTIHLSWRDRYSRHHPTKWFKGVASDYNATWRFAERGDNRDSRGHCRGPQPNETTNDMVQLLRGKKAYFIVLVVRDRPHWKLYPYLYTRVSPLHIQRVAMPEVAGWFDNWAPSGHRYGFSDTEESDESGDGERTPVKSKPDNADPSPQQPVAMPGASGNDDDEKKGLTNLEVANAYVGTWEPPAGFGNATGTIPEEATEWQELLLDKTLPNLNSYDKKSAFEALVKDDKLKKEYVPGIQTRLDNADKARTGFLTSLRTKKTKDGKPFTLQANKDGVIKIKSLAQLVRDIKGAGYGDFAGVVEKSPSLKRYLLVEANAVLKEPPPQEPPIRQRAGSATSQGSIHSSTDTDDEGPAAAAAAAAAAKKQQAAAAEKKKKEKKQQAAAAREAKKKKKEEAAAKRKKELEEEKKKNAAAAREAEEKKKAAAEGKQKELDEDFVHGLVTAKVMDGVISASGVKTTPALQQTLLVLAHKQESANAQDLLKKAATDNGWKAFREALVGELKNVKVVKTSSRRKPRAIDQDTTVERARRRAESVALSPAIAANDSGSDAGQPTQKFQGNSYAGMAVNHDNPSWPSERTTKALQAIGANKTSASIWFISAPDSGDKFFASLTARATSRVWSVLTPPEAATASQGIGSAFFYGVNDAVLPDKPDTSRLDKVIAAWKELVGNGHAIKDVTSIAYSGLTGQLFSVLFVPDPKTQNTTVRVSDTAGITFVYGASTRWGKWGNPGAIQVPPNIANSPEMMARLQVICDLCSMYPVFVIEQFPQASPKSLGEEILKLLDANEAWNHKGITGRIQEAYGDTPIEVRKDVVVIRKVPRLQTLLHTLLDAGGEDNGSNSESSDDE